MQLALLLVMLASLCITLSADCEEVEFKRPGQLSSHEMALSKMNRCVQYPRCLLFACCGTLLMKNIRSFFNSQSCRHYPLYSCMLAPDSPGCHTNASFNARISKVNIFRETLNLDMVEQLINKLPPTPPVIYERLAQREEFRILYLVQGDRKRKLDAVFRQIQHDLIYLSFYEHIPGNLFFPFSTPAMGKMALFLAARQLELAQGWLYNYYVFIDDDADWIGHISHFEGRLKIWQPAIGVPGSIQRSYAPDMISSVVDMDSLLIAYHRETVEVLFPWILDFDRNCFTVSSQLQRVEAAAAYRNHMLVFNEKGTIRVKNRWRRNLPRNCSVEGGNKAVGPLPDALQNHMQALPGPLKHCAVRDIDLVGEWSGVVRAKGEAKYHLMETIYVAPHFVSYSLYPQTGSCPSVGSFNRKPPGCCSVDIMNDESVYDSDEIDSLPDKEHLKLIPPNGTFFDIPNLEEVLGCGNKWQAEYTKFHQSLISQLSPDKSIRQLVVIPSPTGLADQLVAMVTNLYFAILTKRAIRLTTYDLMPNISWAFDSPQLQITASRKEFPVVVFDAMKYRERGRQIAPVYCHGRGKFNWKKVDPNEYAQMCLIHDQDQAEMLFVNNSVAYLPFGQTHAHVLFVASNRGRTYAMFKENPHIRDQLAKLDIATPESCFLCGFYYLFRPNQLVRNKFAPIWRQLTADPNSIIIGIKVRIGDTAFSEEHQNAGYEHGYTIMREKVVTDHFDCAEELEFSLRRNKAAAGRAILWYLIADSLPLRLAAKRKYGDKLITDVVTKPMHSDCEINRIGACNIETVSEALRLAAGDILSLSFADYHVLTKDSGFGRVGAWLSSAHANKPRRHVFNLEPGNTPRSCLYQNADDFIVDARHWSGI